MENEKSTTQNLSLTQTHSITFEILSVLLSFLNYTYIYMYTCAHYITDSVYNCASKFIHKNATEQSHDREKENEICTKAFCEWGRIPH